MYDYICSDCGHEFDYDEGKRINPYNKEEYIVCPFCQNYITELENN